MVTSIQPRKLKQIIGQLSKELELNKTETKFLARLGTRIYFNDKEFRNVYTEEEPKKIDIWNLSIPLEEERDSYAACNKDRKFVAYEIQDTLEEIFFNAYENDFKRNKLRISYCTPEQIANARESHARRFCPVEGFQNYAQANLRDEPISDLEVEQTLTQIEDNEFN